MTKTLKKPPIKFTGIYLILKTSSIAVLLYCSTIQAIEQAYIANQNNDTVSVVATSDNSLIKNAFFDTHFYKNTTLSTQAVAITPAGSKIYIANSFNNTVTVINTVTNLETVNSPIRLSQTLLNSPQCIAIASNGYAYVSQTNGKVDIIDTVTDTVHATLSLTSGNFSTGIAINSKGFVYITQFTTNKLSVIDSKTNTEILGSPFTLTSASNPAAIAINSNDQAYILNNSLIGGLGAVNIFNTINNTNVTQKNLITTSRPSGIAINSSGFAYITNGSGTNNLNVLNTATNLEILGSPFVLTDSSTLVSSVAISPTSGNVYIADTSSNSNIFVLQTTNAGTPSQIAGSPFTTLSTNHPFSIAITPLPIPPKPPSPTPTSNSSVADLLNAVKRYSPLQTQQGIGTK